MLEKIFLNWMCFASSLLLEQESQVSVEVAIPQRYHRAIMGPKGCRIQLITREQEVQIKFPEREDSTAGWRQNKDHYLFRFDLCQRPTSESLLFTGGYL